MKTSSSLLGRLALAALLVATVGSAQAQVVSREADGTLRAPSAGEMKALDAAKASSRASVSRTASKPVVHANGMVTQELDASHLMYTVARRNADGTISQYCVHGDGAAEHLVTSTNVHPQFANKFGKEQQHAVK